MVELFEHGRDIESTALEAAAELVQVASPSEPVLARIAQAFDEGEADDGVRTRFWRQLADRFPRNPYVLACWGDALLAAGHDRDAMEAFVAAFEVAPGLIEEFDEARDLAHMLGEPWWLKYQLVEILAALVAAESDGRGAAGEGEGESEGEGEDDEMDFDIRERYSELLDEYRGDSAALDAIRELGHRITELEDAGVLPRALVRRGDWRR